MKPYLITGSLFSFAGILASSLSSHLFKDLLFLNASYDSFLLAQNLLIFHGLAIVLFGFLADHLKLQLLKYAAAGILIGIFLFAGTIFIKSLYVSFPLGFLTPIGGAVLMLAWLLVMISFIRLKR